MLYNIIKKVLLRFPKNTNFYSDGAKKVLSILVEKEIKEKFKMRLSEQALTALMMALQDSLMHQTDIVPTLKGFNFQLSENEELIVLNPPIVRADVLDDENINATGSD